MKNWEDYLKKVTNYRYDLCYTNKLEPYVRVGNDSLKIGKVTDIEFCDDGVKLKTDITNNWLFFQEVTMIKKIKRVVFNNPCTIILWNDGTKTVVKAENEPYDPEKGLAMCLAKKALGNKGNYYNVFRKWLPKEEEK